MKILVANLGSTSFKFRLLDMANEAELARGSVERIGSEQSPCRVTIGEYDDEMTCPVANHADAVDLCLRQLTHPEHGCVTDAAEISGIGFKTVHGGRVSGVQRVTDNVLQAMEDMATVAPAHNPPYIRAMRLMSKRFPDMPLIAAFETDFHTTIPERQRRYAVPREWAELHHVKRWGFHGASHRYIAERMAELLGRNGRRVISCHLGGSSSLCAIRQGESVATTMGMSPQTGLPQNNRVGNFDPFALPWLMQRTGKTLDGLLEILANQSGLYGMSGTSGDIRDLEGAAIEGDENAQLALEVYTTDIRRQLGGLLVELGGADAVVFTGGIGENAAGIRAAVCKDLDELGIVLDSHANVRTQGESEISARKSRASIWVVPTNEELIVARQAQQLLQG